jgi:hypothetical protein
MVKKNHCFIIEIFSVNIFAYVTRLVFFPIKLHVNLGHGHVHLLTFDRAYTLFFKENTTGEAFVPRFIF